MGDASRQTLDTLHRAQRGDDEALNRVLERLRPALQRYARRRLPPFARVVVDTQDLVQEAMIDTVRRLPDLALERDADLLSYMRAAVRREVIDRIRAAQARPRAGTLDDQLPANASLPDRELRQHELRERFEAALESLSEEEHLAVILRVDLELKFAEIANAMSLPSADAARMATARGLAKVAKRLSDAR